jgi:hypothetical protein
MAFGPTYGAMLAAADLITEHTGEILATCGASEGLSLGQKVQLAG